MPRKGFGHGKIFPSWRTSAMRRYERGHGPLVGVRDEPGPHDFKFPHSPSTNLIENGTLRLSELGLKLLWSGRNYRPCRMMCARRLPPGKRSPSNRNGSSNGRRCQKLSFHYLFDEFFYSRILPRYPRIQMIGHSGTSFSPFTRGLPHASDNILWMFPGYGRKYLGPIWRGSLATGFTASPKSSKVLL